MSAIPTEPDSVYAVILCFGQGDAARQALRETPLYVMQGGQGEHAGGEHAAASSQSHTAPPTPLRYSSSLPSLASGGAMVTDTPLPDGADAEHENAGNDDADEPSLGGSPRSRTTTASLGDTGTPVSSTPSPTVSPPLNVLPRFRMSH
ncbi:hypothetical protein PENSPDRAFT_377899 [Peniophora sp. CONT]|nr:hypothetical protein PENSPDRAFT_377899 [Peniophora sp. CONT]